MAKNHSTPPLFIVLSLFSAALGLALSVYATWHHIDYHLLGGSGAACNINDTFSCDSIAASAYSELFGFPLGIFGLGYFLGMALLVILALVKPEYASDNLKSYRALAGVGVLVSVVLFAISHSQVGSYCLTCIGVYTVCLAQAGVVFIWRTQLPQGWSWTALSNGSTYPALALIVTMVVYNFAKPAPHDFKQDVAQTPELLKSLQLDPTLGQLSAQVQSLPFAKNPYSGLGEDYRKGSDNARVVIQEFADFQCPACRSASQTLDQLAKEFGQQVLVVFRHYPLDQSCNSSINRELHPHACDAAVLTRCAGRQGLFWPLHDKIFKEQSSINKANLEKWAVEVGLSREVIQQCRASADMLAKVKADIELGNRIGVDATPTIFINGRKVVGQRDLDALRRIVAHLLETSS